MITNKTKQLKSNILDQVSNFSELPNIYKSDFEYSLLSENDPGSALAIFCHSCRYILERSGDSEKDRRYIEVIKSLIRLGADTNCDWEGRTSLPLFSESEKGNLAAVKILLKYTAKVDGLSRNDPFKLTPLMVAVREGHLGIVDLLVKTGANINSVTANGQTPFIIACIQKHPAVALALLKSEANWKIGMKRNLSRISSNYCFTENNIYERLQQLAKA